MARHADPQAVTHQFKVRLNAEDKYIPAAATPIEFNALTSLGALSFTLAFLPVGTRGTFWDTRDTGTVATLRFPLSTALQLP
jgi:hypothetical protein